MFLAGIDLSSSAKRHSRFFSRIKVRYVSFPFSVKRWNTIRFFSVEKTFLIKYDDERFLR
jgi:hypothetical protein